MTSSKTRPITSRAASFSNPPPHLDPIIRRRSKAAREDVPLSPFLRSCSRRCRCLWRMPKINGISTSAIARPVQPLN